MAERLRLWLERAERGYHLRDAATDESGLRVLIALAPGSELRASLVPVRNMLWLGSTLRSRSWQAERIA